MVTVSASVSVKAVKAHKKIRSSAKAIAIRTEKPCSTCRVVKLLTEYANNKSAGDGLQNNCRSCAKEQRKLFSGSRHGYIINLVCSSRTAAKNKKKDLVGEHTLTTNEMEAQLDSTDDCCYYSGMPLTFKRFSNWQASIERLDNSVNYMDSNCVGIALEFNTRPSAQWSQEKIHYAATHTDFVPPEDLQDIIQELRRESIRGGGGANRRVETKEVNGVVVSAKCNKCSIWKDRQDFNKQLGDGCKACTAKKDNARRNTWRGRIQLSVNSARAASKSRKGVRNRKNMGDFELTYDDVVDMYERQKGVCYYSGIPLECTGPEWLMSLERLNVNLDYSASNVRLVCQEFNAIDKTCEAKGAVDGAGGWTRSKYALFRETYNRKLESTM